MKVGLRHMHFEEAYREYDENKLPATAVGMMSEDYKERFKAEYKQLEIRFDGLRGMLKKWDEGTLVFEPTCPRRRLIICSLKPCRTIWQFSKQER